MNDRAAFELVRARRGDLVALYRYGSTAHGTAGPESDVDYALLARAPLEALERFERCVRRVREIYDGRPENLTGDPLRQDAVLLNLQRACEVAIDAAMHLVRTRRLGLPAETRAAFDLVETAGIVDAELAGKLKRRVGFRDLAIHEYRELDLGIVGAIVERELGCFLDFAVALVGTSAAGEADGAAGG
jgi:uncharacterized protein YutE (UPF0331/DUF86 family)